MSDRRQRDPDSPAHGAEAATGDDRRRRHSDVVQAAEAPTSGPVKRDSGAIAIVAGEIDGDSVLDPKTLVSGEEPNAASHADALVDTLRDPGSDRAAPFRETLPADEVKRRRMEEREAEARQATSTLSETLSPSNRSYDALAMSPGPSSEEEPLADPLIGMVVADRYRILERIGRGGMGIVYRVQHTSIGKLLAMKLLTGELSTNKEVVRRFKQEALTVSKLSSPHTVQVFDYGVWNHLTYLVMELVEGQDLGKVLRNEGPMPFARLGKLMVQVCASLAEAHDKGIVHRDIKPENIMIITDPRGTEMAKVLDFGLAKLRENAELNEVTLQGAVIGTPYYMSPEQVTSEEVDGRTDVYSLGAVMFRALTGTQAFKAATPMGMFTKHLNEAPPSAVDRAPRLGIPEGVSDAVQRCMAKDPNERFATIAELRDVLLEELHALGVSGSDMLDTPSSPGRTAKRAKKKPAPKGDRMLSQIATRAELLSYERKLRRMRYGTSALLAAVLLGGGATVAYYALAATKRELVGREREPNDVAGKANPLPLGRAVTGYVGQKLEGGEGDRDFYHFTLDGEGQRHIRIELSALPNFAICAILYRVDFPQPLAQYCSGHAGQDLRVPALRLDAGPYLVAVMQDRNPGNAAQAAFVLENVSDPYQLMVQPLEPEPGQEIEPNDSPPTAQILAADRVLEGTLAWMGDEDVVCAPPDASAVRWTIEDPGRPPGTVLEATPLEGTSLGPVVRVHGPDAKPFGKPRFEADVNSPYRGPLLPRTQAARCLKLRLTSDPWAERASGVRPDGAPYRVRWEAK